MNGHHPLDFNRERNNRDDLIHKAPPVTPVRQPTIDPSVDAHMLPTLHHKKMYRPVTVIFPAPGDI